MTTTDDMGWSGVDEYTQGGASRLKSDPGQVAPEYGTERLPAKAEPCKQATAGHSGLQRSPGPYSLSERRRREFQKRGFLLDRRI